jgi:preprotein translocase subunit SecD
MLNYIGPGMDGGALSVIIGILISFFIALFAIVWYPIKRLIKKFKGKSNTDNTTHTTTK